MNIHKTIFVLFAVSSLFAPWIVGADWPQWRGIGRDGTWTETGLVKTFDENPLPARWKADISNGYSGPTVADGRVYVTDRIIDPEQTERVLCFDAMTGDLIWKHSYPCTYQKVGYPNGPRASVLIRKGKAYSLGTMGHVFCLDAATGNVLWQRDLFTEYQIQMPIWGITASPLIEEDILILQIGGKDNACLVGLDKDTGKEIWRALPDKASYSAPIMIEQAGKRVLVCVTGERVVGLDPADGSLHWSHPFEPTRMVITVPTPVLYEDFLFVSAFYDGSLVLKVDPDTLNVSEVWRRLGPNETQTDALHCMNSTALIMDGLIYGVDSYGELRCLDLLTGDRIWESLEAVPRDRWANIHLVRNGDRVWMFNERGELIISTLSREGFEEISRAKIIEPTTGQLGSRGGVCWSHPAFANKHVYARNDNELVCVDLTKKN